MTYGIVYIVAPLDFRAYSELVNDDFFGGIYTDINAFWYNDVGLKIIFTMLFTAPVPIFEFTLFWLIRYLRRACD